MIKEPEIPLAALPILMHQICKTPARPYGHIHK